LAHNKFFWGAVLWTLLFTVSCLITADSFHDLERFKIPYKDKYVHFGFYFGFTVLWVFALKHRSAKESKTRLTVFFSAVLYGIIIEICQGLFTVNRSADITDVMANTAGSAAAVLGLWLLDKYKK
jgi:VanZ family protein